MIRARVLVYRFLASALIIVFAQVVLPVLAQGVTVSDGAPSILTIEQSNGAFELSMLVPEGWFLYFSDSSGTFYAATTEAAIEKSNDRDAEFDPDEIAITIGVPSLLERLDLSITASPEDTLTTFIEFVDGKGRVVTDDSFEVPAARARLSSAEIPTGSSEVYALAFDGGTVLVAVLPGGAIDPVALAILQSIRLDEVEAPAASDSIRQWATRADGSSQYAAESWSFMQATGEPDTLDCGDIPTAWASESSTGKDFLVVAFDQPVIPTQINIYQTYNPGSIIRVGVGSSANPDQVRTLSDSADPPGNTDCPGVFTLDVNLIDVPIDFVVIYLNQAVGGSWNEIDAVELVGTPVN